MMQVTRSCLAVSLLALAACGASSDGDAPGVVAQNAAPATGTECSFADLKAPATSCQQGGDSAYRGVCVVDCFGNVTPATHAGMQMFPAGRYYGLILSPHGGKAPLFPGIITAAVAPYNVANQNGHNIAEADVGSRVPYEVSTAESGDLFIKLDHRMEGAVQFAVNLQFTPVTGYAYRAYAGGEPQLEE